MARIGTSKMENKRSDTGDGHTRRVMSLARLRKRDWFMKPFFNVVRKLRAIVSREYMQPGSVYNGWEFVFAQMWE